MRNFLLSIFFALSKLLVHHSYSQNKIVTLEKNTNVLAQDLFHDLNSTQDTLILKSKRRMHYVYSINQENKREIDRLVNDYKLNIPLHKLSQGKHLFAVSYLQRKIVFVIRVYDPNSSYIAPKREENVATRNN